MENSALIPARGGILAATSPQRWQVRVLVAGAATGGRTAGAGSPAASGGRRELGSHFGIAGAHESFTIRFFTLRTFHVWITAKNEFFKIGTAIVAMKFKDGHSLIISLKYFSILQQQESYLAAAWSILIIIPSVTSFKRQISPDNFPTILTALAGRISPGRLIGVGPKKRHKAHPRGQ